MAHQLNLNTTALEELKAKAQALPAEKKVQASKSVTPGTTAQTVSPDSGYDGLASVTVNAMPAGSVGTPSISVNSSTGVITATTAVDAGYVDGTDKTGTKQMTVQAAQTITPGTSNKTIASGKYLTGTQTIKGDANLVAGNIVSGKSIFGVSGSAPSLTLDVTANVSTGNVTATNGSTSVSGTLSGGKATLVVPKGGTWTVNATSGERKADTNTGALVASDDVALTFFEATVGCYINSDTAQTVTCTNGTTTYTATGTGAVTFTVYERGTWTVSATFDSFPWTFKPNVQTHQGMYSQVFGLDFDVSKTLNDNTWDVVSQVSDLGIGANLWAVGDTKEITINGTVGNTTFSNLSTWVYILGFDHNSDIEGTGKIHFQIGKTAQTSGTSICLIDSKYNKSVSSTAGYFNMNYSNSSSGGWKSSKMRAVLLGNNNTPASPLSGSLVAALPSDLRSVMKACTKYSDNTGGGSDTASYVTATTDYLWLLAEYEVFGTRSYANSAEQNYQQQYTYFANGNSKVKYHHSATTSTAAWWLRSTYAPNSHSFCYVAASGSANNYAAYYSYGLAPAFCV